MNMTYVYIIYAPSMTMYFYLVSKSEFLQGEKKKSFWVVSCDSNVRDSDLSDDNDDDITDTDYFTNQLKNTGIRKQEYLRLQQI